MEKLSRSHRLFGRFFQDYVNEKLDAKNIDLPVIKNEKVRKEKYKFPPDKFKKKTAK